MHEVMARFFAAMGDWVTEPEVSFSIYGERGIIDILAWHPTRRILLVIELKTEIVDVNEMLGTLDRKRRLAMEIARTRGWHPTAVGSWLVVAPSRANRRALAEHRAVLRSKFPIDGHAVRIWLRDPSGPIDAVSSLPTVRGMHPGPSPAPIRRVSKRRAA